MDMADIKGQWHVKRALEVAVAGDHNVLMIGGSVEDMDDLKRAMKSIVSDPVFIKARPAGRGQHWTVGVVGKQIVVSILPCLCGNFTHPRKECTCTPKDIQKHLAQLPAEVLDKIDVHIEVPVICNPNVGKRKGETSEVIKARIAQAKKNKRPKKLDKEADELLKLAILEIGISARAYDKIIEVSRTIAQMDGKDKVEACHISEAIGYRSLDRNLWA